MINSSERGLETNSSGYLRGGWHPTHSGSRAGLTLWEMILFLTMLAVAGGASIFFFFLSSRDMVQARERQLWEKNVHTLLDQIHEELMNAALVDLPFSGEGKECFFRRTLPAGSLEASLQSEGLVVSKASLIHMTRSGDGASRQTPFREYENPLLVKVKKGIFRRLSPKQLEIELHLAPPDNPEAAEIFRRTIYLRNE